MIGFLIAKDDASATALGATNNTSLTQRQEADAIVAALNAHGGLSGHRIRSVFAEIDSTGNYQAQEAAACSTFTQDNHVIAVLQNGNYVDPDFYACLTNAHVVLVNDSYATGDAGLLRENPTTISPLAPSLDRQLTGVFSHLTQSRYLSATNKIGVIYESCPYTTRAYDHTLQPLAGRLGLTIAKTLKLDCTTGFSSAAPASSAMSSAILAFRQSGVDRVAFISSFEATLALLFTQAAEAQGYRPGYVLSSAAAPSLLGPQIPAAQAAHLHGMGWLPATDASLGHQPPPTEAAQRCFALYAGRGLRPQSTSDQYYMGGFCDGLFLLEEALAMTPGPPSSITLLQGIEAVGGRYRGVTPLDGAMSVTASHRDAPTRMREWAWSTGCGCSVYLAAPMRYF